MPQSKQRLVDPRGSRAPGLFLRLWADEQATTTLEYTLILVLIVVTGLLAWQSFGTSLSEHAADNASQVGIPDTNKGATI